MSEDIISKIQKLLAKAESTNHEAEADAFFAKVQELMVKHAIDEAALKAAGKITKEQIIEVDVSIKLGMPRTKPLRGFLNDLASAMNCRMLTYSNSKSPRNIVIGYETDARFTALLFNSVLIQMHGALLREVKAARNEHTRNYDFGPGYKFREGVWRRNFIEAYLTRVIVRIHERYVKVDETHGTGTSIVLRDRKQDATDWMVQNYQVGRTKYRRTNRAYDPAARAAGDRSGQSADISAGRNAIKTERKELT